MNGDTSANGDRSESEEELIFPELEAEDLIEPLRKARVLDEEAESNEKRKIKYQKKKRHSPSSAPSEPVILSPQPVPFTGSVIPDAPDLPRPDLPVPLHSGIAKISRHEHVGPVELTPNLDWRKEDWFEEGKEREGSPSDGWGEVERVRGPAEREDEDGEDEAMCKLTSHWHH